MIPKLEIGKDVKMKKDVKAARKARDQEEDNS